MTKKFVNRFALALALTVIGVPTGKIAAQSSGAPVITGSDPTPTGDVATDMAVLMLLAAASNG